MLRKNTRPSRRNKQLSIFLFDGIALILMLIVAFSMRLGVWFVPEAEIAYLIYLSPLIAWPIFIRFGLYKTVIRFIDFNALWTQAQAVSLYAILWGVIAFISAAQGIPRSIILINWALSLLLIGGSRLIAYWFFNQLGNNTGKKVIIYGAGSAGRELLTVLKHSKQYTPVAFIDDDSTLIKHVVGGIEIFDKHKLSSLLDKHQVSEILLAIPSIGNTQRRHIIDFLQNYPVSVRTLPSISEIVSGKIQLSDLQRIKVQDLLGRDAVVANEQLLSQNITHKVVMVTGAGGSIGSELCRQIVALKPKVLILYELSELALYNIDKELSNTDVDTYPLLGSVNNANRLMQVLKHFDVDTIYHAAAYKHVPMVEFNNSEGANNNVFGTLSVAQAAIDARIETFVLISTDKAVRPTNTMGATKRCAELILQALAATQNITKFTMVRFGNVLDSSGSVIPLFKQQIKNGGPVTVTDINIVRYFMTIHEAVELVIQAGAMGKGGDVFVLDMGKAIKIDDLAKKMIQLSGLEVKDQHHPDGDIEIEYTGLRPGEKLFEELLIGENVSDTDNPLIMRAREDSLSWSELQSILTGLNTAIIDGNQQALRQLLMRAVPDFQPQCDVADLLNRN